MMKDGKHAGISIRASVLLLAVSAVLSAAARMIPGFAEKYSSSVYPLIVNTLGRLSGLASFSVAEQLLAVIPLALIADLIILLSGRRSNRCPVRIFLCHLLVTASVLLFLYTACCGINYYREPFVENRAYESAAFTEDELAEFCEYAAEEIRASSDSGEDLTYPDADDLAYIAIESMKTLSEKDYLHLSCQSLKGFYPRPKELSFMSGIFSAMGVSGIYSPFTVEANINGMMTGLEKPFTACHELSHLRGYMNEGEANFIGWLACIGSSDPLFNRSGWLIAWIYAGNSLYRVDPDRYFQIREKLPEDALRELEENSLFWSEHETGASEVQDRVNDAYLKSNGQKDGIMTYGRLTTLMLLWFFGD